MGKMGSFKTIHHICSMGTVEIHVDKIFKIFSVSLPYNCDTGTQDISILVK